MKGEDLFQSHNLENVFYARTKGRQGQLAAKALDRLKIFDQRGQARGIDIVHAGEIKQQSQRFLARLGLEEIAQFGRAFQIDIARNRNDGYGFLGTFGDLHHVRATKVPE